jgi:ABC-2 type transport system ATP-binding protein
LHERFSAPAEVDVKDSQNYPASQVLSVQHLTKRYGDVVAVNDISFQVGPDEIVGLLGLNGAGKTTTINMVLGVLKPTEGTILVNGMNLAEHRTHALERTNFAAVYAPLPGNLTVYENLRFFGLLYGVKHLRDRIGKLLEYFHLEKFRDTKCGVLSSGEQTRVCLAKAMLNRPNLLLLDEPTASIDPATAQEIRSRIRHFADTNHGGILWTSHNMYEVEEVCDRVLLLAQGRILLEGDPKNLLQVHGKETLEELFIAVARESLAVNQFPENQEESLP